MTFETPEQCKLIWLTYTELRDIGSEYTYRVTAWNLATTNKCGVYIYPKDRRSR